MGGASRLTFTTLFMSLLRACQCFHLQPMTCNVSLAEGCNATLYYVPPQPKSAAETAALFRVPSDAVRRTKDGFLVEVSCSCPAYDGVFVHHAGYTVQPGDTWDFVSVEFGLLVMEKPEKQLLASMYVSLDLFCGCIAGLHIVTYTIQPGDTLYTISLRFAVTIEDIRKVNDISHVSLIYAGDKIFIPITAKNNINGLLLHEEQGPHVGGSTKSHDHLLVIIITTPLSVISVALSILVWIYYNKPKKREPSDHLSQKNGNSRPTPSSQCVTSLPAQIPSRDSKWSSLSSQSSIRATVFPYSEVCTATSNFNASRIVGQGSHGSVYRGRLRGVDVAVKKMKKTKSKEFFAELNVLCKVDHNNLIVLIGYSAGDESLFLVYEFAHNGALREHLHNPEAKGHKPLPWHMRVQIALDAAKGLEYLHSDIRPVCVHRDVKTSNILLDSNFRGKISDFGLVKLLESSPEIGEGTSKVVGTVGYLSPEYIRDGCVSAKSDVFAFGVVLMELITGQPALCKRPTAENGYSERQSLVDLMLSAFEGGQDRMTKLAAIVDPNLKQYDRDSLLQMAILSKDCVNEAWKCRPNASQVVNCLYHMRSSMQKNGSGAFERF